MLLKTVLIIATALAGLAAAPWATATYAETIVAGAGAGAGIDPSYGPVPINSTGVVAAAQFAAGAKSVELKTILKARQAATANLHFIICMRVNAGSTAYLVETKVSRAAGKPYSLDAWTKVKTCK
jgi:hypothetical protein